MKFIFTTVLALIFSFLISSQIAIAEEIDNSSELGKDSLEINENVKDKKSAEIKRSEEDIFGDEQTFPFIAGLGKNAAH